jgi:UcrQ family
MGQLRYFNPSLSSSGTSHEQPAHPIPSHPPKLRLRQVLTIPSLPPPGSRPQKGVTSYSLSANRQKPLAGTLHAAIFNVGRRTRDQILFWLTPMVVAYLAMQWAIEKYAFTYKYVCQRLLVQD